MQALNEQQPRVPVRHAAQSIRSPVRVGGSPRIREGSRSGTPHMGGSSAWGKTSKRSWCGGRATRPVEGVRRECVQGHYQALPGSGSDAAHKIHGSSARRRRLRERECQACAVIRRMLLRGPRRTSGPPELTGCGLRKRCMRGAGAHAARGRGAIGRAEVPGQTGVWLRRNLEVIFRKYVMYLPGFCMLP